MTNLVGWIKSASARVFDPSREHRVTAVAEAVWTQITQQRRNFKFDLALLALGAEPQDRSLVADRVYEGALDRAWKDGVISPKERESLWLISELVGLSQARVGELDRAAGVRMFQQTLARALADGALDAAERERLSQVATSFGTTVRELMLSTFAKEGEGILRGMFAAVTEATAFSARGWETLVEATRGLGLTERELQAVIRPQAERCVEHCLADVKADGCISPSERQTLQWLIATLHIAPAFRVYVESEIEIVDRLCSIRAGRLPSIVAPQVSVRSGEIVHEFCHARYDDVKQLKGGPRVERHDGELAITDCRLLFSSSTKSIELNHRKVIRLLPFAGGVEVRSSGKGGGYYHFHNNADTTLAIYSAAVAKANQTLVEQQAESRSRHIPRDVRQRVWQRFGDRCAECNSDQYLEFDHIIPHARGGSNADANVQLLCRGCNLKKSDNL